MASWYEAKEGEETGHVRATNTRTAVDKAFTLMCGREYTLPIGEKMSITVLRLPKSNLIAQTLEKSYQDMRALQKAKRKPNFG
jgi:ribosomal protein L20A (L18A)